MAKLKIPAPVLQLDVYDGGGRFIGRSDFGWKEAGLLGEFDGRVKYGKLLRPGEDPTDVVIREKQREDRLRRVGWDVVRFMQDDLRQPDHFRRLVMEQYNRGLRADGPAQGPLNDG